MINGLVVAARYGVYQIKGEDNVIYSCKPRGILKKNKKVPVVGDYVLFNEDEFVIEDIKERKTLLKRPNIANIDQLLIIFSIVEPEFSYHLAFKYLTYANKYGLDAKIIVTKIDKKDVDPKALKEIKETFNQVGTEVYFVSNKSGSGLMEVKELFKNKISSLIGQSGVGKSSLLNAIDPSYKRNEGEYSYALGRGKHQTKETILLPYEDGYIADTPGFSSLDLNLYKEDIAKYFPSFLERSTKCYYHDCLHISEPKCEVKKALEEQEIPQKAYESYLKLSEEAISYLRRYN